MIRSDILNSARRCVCGDREYDYGVPENNFANIARLWADYLETAHPDDFKFCHALTAKDVAIMMALLKIARIATNNKEDSFVDLAGYAACAGELATEVIRPEVEKPNEQI